MRTSQLLKVVVLSIITLGLYYILLRRKAKRNASISSGDFKRSVQIPFQINDLVASLGGIDNIEEANATTNKLSVVVYEIAKVRAENLKLLKLNSAFISGQNVSIAMPMIAQAVLSELHKLRPRPTV